MQATETTLAVETGVIEAELARHGSYASVTRGVSMRPLFKTRRDVVIIMPPPAEFKKYDVVLYTAPSSHKYIMHRVIRIDGDTLIIRGDNTYRLEYIPRSKIIGILTEFNRNGKHHTTEDVGYKIYSRIWHYIYPVRHFFHLLRRLASKIKHKLFK